MRWSTCLILAAWLAGSLARGADELPPRAVARLGSHAFYHGPGIECAVLSPDGKRAASLAHTSWVSHRQGDEMRDGTDRLIVVWDATTGERLREVQAPESPVVALAFSPDGKHLAASCGTSARARVVLFAADSGKELREFSPFGDTVRRVQFAAGGDQLLTADTGPAVSAWDVATGKRLRHLTPPAGPSEWVKEDERAVEGVPSPDGTLVAWLYWRLPDYSKLPPGEVPPPAVPRPTALVLALVGKDEPLQRTTFAEGRLDTFAFSPEGKTFYAGGDRLTAHDAATGKELFRLDGSAHRLVASPDGRHLVTATGQSQVRLWDLQTRKLRHELYAGFRYIASETLRTPQAITADGKTLLVATDTTLRLFDTATGKERPVAGHRAPVVPRFSADGRTLFTTCDERRCRWDLSPGKEPKLAADEPRKPWEGICGDQALAHSPDGLLFLAGGDPVKLGESSSGRVLRELRDSRGAFRGLFSPDGRRALLRFGLTAERLHGLIGLYEVRTGERTGEIADTDFVGEPAFSPDGRLVAYANNVNGIVLHDAATGKVVSTLRSSRALPHDRCHFAQLLFSPDGQILFAANHCRVREPETNDGEKWEAFPSRVFRVDSGREVSRFYSNPETMGRGVQYSCAACSPDNRLVAFADQESATIRVVEVAGGKVRVEFQGHRHGVRGLAFSPDGKTLASGGDDNVLFLWDVTGAFAAAAAKEPNDAGLAAWWADLVSGDSRRAGDALAAFVRTPGRGVPFLKDRLRPAAALDEKRVAGLIADLDAEGFETREAAARELGLLGERVESALRRALKSGPPLEVGRRLEALLDKVETGTLPPETLREVRAVEALEHLGTPDAIDLLKGLATGDAEARLTRDAGAALDRLRKRR